MINEHLDCIEYIDDILKHLIEIEKKRKKMQFKSPQISCRAKLVDLIKNCGEKLNLSRTTVHLAVYLLDTFMDSYKISLDKLNITALGCILIASKIEEKDTNVPKILQLKSIANDNYTKENYKLVEKILLQFFDFQLTHPTVATFIEIYQSKIYTIEDYLINENYNNKEKRIELVREGFNNKLLEVKNVLLNFTDVILHDKRLVNVRPSLMAAATLHSVRKIMKILPTWPKRLEILTTYKSDHIETFSHTLIYCRKSIIMNTSMNLIIDSGFISESNDVTDSDDDNVDSDNDDNSDDNSDNDIEDNDKSDSNFNNDNDNDNDNSINSNEKSVIIISSDSNSDSGLKSDLNSNIQIDSEDLSNNPREAKRRRLF